MLIFNYVPLRFVPLRLVKDPKEYPWSSYRVYAYGREDGITDRHEIYEALGKERIRRQKAYREFVHSNRDKEEQEIKEKMGKGVIGLRGFGQRLRRELLMRDGQEKEDLKNNLYLFVI